VVVKLIGAALVIAACTGIGFRIAADYRQRPRQLRALMHAIRVLRTEIEYTVTPLPLAFDRVAERSERPIAQLFATAAEVLRMGGLSADEAFHRGIEELRAASALKQPELHVMETFGKTLGTSDRLHQSQHIEAALVHLASIEREAREAQRRNERLWQYLGSLTGLLLVILLY
jgi:stage III sporulation protein AB